VVLLDIGLPELDGYVVARLLRERTIPPGMMLVAMTGYGQETDRLQALDAGFDHHLVKPVDFPRLERLLATVGDTGTDGWRPT
jgi:CheY-like chemotaxis protein